MSFFETAQTCDLTEYESKKDSRLSLVSSCAGNLVVLMLRLESTKFEAAKIPAKINTITPSSTQPSRLDLSLVDKNLNSFAQHNFPTQNDFIITQGILKIKINGIECDPTECYARDYFEEMMPPDFSLSTALELTA